MAEWIRHVQPLVNHIVLTPPIERQDVFQDLDRMLGGSVHFDPCPVTSFDTCDRWRVGLQRALEYEADFIETIKQLGPFWRSLGLRLGRKSFNDEVNRILSIDD